MKLGTHGTKKPLRMREDTDDTPKAASRPGMAKKGGARRRLRLRGNY